MHLHPGQGKTFPLYIQADWSSGMNFAVICGTVALSLEWYNYTDILYPVFQSLQVQQLMASFYFFPNFNFVRKPEAYESDVNFFVNLRNFLIKNLQKNATTGLPV